MLAFVVVHVGVGFLDDETFNNFFLNFAMTPERVVNPTAMLAPPVWIWPGFTLVTYAFLHGDYVHLTFNVLWFMIFGTAVSRRVGTSRFLALMLITTVGAAVTHLAFYWDSPLPVVGVSGAVSGLMGAAFRFILPNPNPGTTWPPPALPLFSRPVLLMTAVWSVLNVVLGVVGLTPDGFGYPIAWEAHLGGYFTGLLLFPIFDRRRGWLR
ncbi:MAG: rhomboid family intramembrane serine protease [Micropepsaceae bacterium]